MAEKHLYEIKNIETSFRTDGKMFKAVEDVSVYLNPGEIIGIVGESGSGKSVTMMSALQLIQEPGKVTGGEVYLDGSDKNMLSYGPNSAEVRKMRGGRVSMIFQEPMTSLNPVLTVGFQIQENIIEHLHLSKEEAKKRAIEMMKMVNIPDAEERFTYYPQQFSGGMRQRIMIAMAMSSEPSVLVADEATTALDVTTQAQILEMIRDIAKKTNTAVVIVTHNLGIVARFAERIYVMYAGGIVETTDAERLFENPEHPYTRALLRAIPRLDDDRDRILIPIDGLPPNPALRPEYCPFYDRCEYHMDKCKSQKKPVLKELEKDHFCACHLTEAEKALKKAEIDAKPVKKAERAVIGDEICLDVKDVKKYFPIYKGMMRKHIGDVKAIEDISFRVRKGETLGIVGESGCGKSTTVKSLLRVVEPTDGEVILNRQDFLKLKGADLKKARRNIKMIFQDPYSSLNPRMTVRDIIGEPADIEHVYKTEEEREKLILDTMEMVGLNKDFADRYPHEFSGGQRQRIGIARAIILRPEIVVCDEPVSALDVSVQAKIINLLKELQAKMNISYIFISHDLGVVKHIADRVLVMYQGHVVEEGTRDEIFENPKNDYTKLLLASIPEIGKKMDFDQFERAFQAE